MLEGQPKFDLDMPLGELGLSNAVIAKYSQMDEPWALVKWLQARHPGMQAAYAVYFVKRAMQDFKSGGIYSKSTLREAIRCIRNKRREQAAA